MECNKDEALRAKDIAEKKFNAKDIIGAKKFAIKAQTLYPGLEGISQMLSTFDIYISAENKINGENDWYAILSVNASADEETVRKQYRKLALALHPDKNKSIGADGAFKLLSEAWSVLSDKGRRSTYDQKTKARKHQQRSSRSGRDASASNSNGFRNYDSKSSSNLRSQKTSRHPTYASTPSHHANPNTFWTACSWCKMQYEYLRVYLNHNLLCPNCHEPFLALEMASPANGFHSTPWPSYQMNLNHNMSSHNSFVSGRNSCTGTNAGTAGYTHGAGFDSLNSTNFHWGPFSRAAGVASATASTAAAVKAANVVHHTYEKVRREREEAQNVARREERKKHQISKRDISSVNGNSSNCMTNANIESVMKKKRTFDDIDCRAHDGNPGSGANKNSPNSVGVNDFPQRTASYDLVRELSSHDYRGMLLDKSKKALVKKIADMKAEKEKPKSREKAPVADIQDKDKSVKTMHQKKEKVHELASDDSNVCSTMEEVKTASINVPDPDFHDFDNDRLEASFEANQVWAAYDDDDGMPRFYALIHKVISLKPFKMQFSWLNSKTNSELGPLNWVACGFTKICGDFRVGRYEISNTVNVFSHRVKWEKGIRGVVRIFPRKAEVWALYRNWSPNWNETTPDEVIHKYDMVEVLDDFNEEEGVLVTPLVKIAGFKTVFHRHMDPQEVRRIPREEMFRFSHQVPSQLLTGDEAPNVPKGCRELDPAATPLELLRVITEIKEEYEIANGTERRENIVGVDEEIRIVNSNLI